MHVPSFKRDTEIVFQQRTLAQESVYGTGNYTWADFATELADVQDILPSRAENLADGINIQRRPTRIRTLFRDDITSDMRVKIGMRTLQIVAGPAELGRRDGLEMICEEYSTEGNAP